MDQQLLRLTSGSDIGEIDHHFRLYYNHTLYPELKRLERKRKRLLLLLTSSVLLFLAVLGATLYLNVLAFTLFMMAPVGFYITFLLYRVQAFRVNFKPRVVNLLIDFIDDLPNIQNLRYDAEGSISQENFIASGIFTPSPLPFYKCEDFIEGKVGELSFELSELDAREMSPVRARLDYVFRGVFLQAKTLFPTQGQILMLPRAYRKYLNRSIRLFTRQHARPVEEGLHENFDREFLVYATDEAIFEDPLTHATRLYYFFPPSLQRTLSEYRRLTGKEIYASFRGSDIYIAISSPEDILEPNIFQSNVDYNLVREFFEDILLLILLVNHLDKTH